MDHWVKNERTGVQRMHASTWMTAGVVLLSGLAGCGSGQAEDAPALATVEVVRRNLQITAEATGQLEPLRKVEVKSKASGEVLEVLVDTGDRVEPGTLLARIDARDVQNDFNQAQADYEVARERFVIAEAQRTRSENLLQAGVITSQEHENRNLDFANARAALVRAETSLELSRLRLQDVVIRSPMVGTVLDKNVEDGVVIQSASGSVSGGTTLLTIANLETVQVRTLIDQTDVGRIEAGMPVSVRVEALPDRTFRGVVEKIEPQATVQQNVVMFPVVVQLDNSEGLLRPGMTAEVTITIAERSNVLTLPNNAVVNFGELAAAASVLGVAAADAELDRAVFQDLNRQLAERREPAGQGAAPAESGAGAGAREGRAASGAAPGAAGGPPATPAAADPAAATTAGARGSAAGAPSQPRQGIVFVQGADGRILPRAILIGVNDWNNSEILIGVEEGEVVALIGGAALRAAQQERMAQIQGRMGGGLPFGR